jgi:hypothetical protein
MTLKIILTIALAALAGWAFRWGGSANAHARWARMLGMEISALAGLIVWFGWSGWLIPITALAWTESTYFKKRGQDATWWNWLLCGIQYALIPLPLVFLHMITWQGFLTRSIVLVPLITIWRTLMTDVDWSESGAGAFQILTLPLLAAHKLFFII